jgi:hypothetical protein
MMLLIGFLIGAAAGVWGTWAAARKGYIKPGPKPLRPSGLPE